MTHQHTEEIISPKQNEEPSRNP